MNSLTKHPSHFNLFVVALLLLQLTLSLQDDRQGRHRPYFYPNHEYIAGKTMEYLPDPIYYDTYIPIIYRVPIPKHTENALRLIWGSVDKCQSKHTTSKNLCPVAYHLFKVTKKLGDDMGFWKPYYVNHTATEGESTKKRTGFEIICNEIGPHFFRSYTSKWQLSHYVNALEECSRIKFPVNFKELNESWVVDKAVYYKMLESYKKAYFSELPSKGSVDWGITLGTYTSVHGLLLTNHAMESVRLATAHTICQSSLIPETFVSMEMLENSLHEVEQNISKHNYKLVYNNFENHIEDYYKLPIADCTFSDDYSFIVRILVPIKRRESSHRLVEINTIPFLEERKEHLDGRVRLCRLKLVSPKFTLIEEMKTGLLLDTRCEPNQLCKTSEVSTVFERDACTVSLLTNNRRLITDTCKFSCFPVSSLALPIIKRVSSDTYIVVGNSESKINLNCFHKPRELIPITMKNVGVMRIKLACDCQLLHSDEVTYRPRDPCRSNTTIRHLLPYHWHPKDPSSGNEDGRNPGKSKESDLEPDLDTEPPNPDNNGKNPIPIGPNPHIPGNKSDCKNPKKDPTEQNPKKDPTEKTPTKDPIKKPHEGNPKSGSDPKKPNKSSEGNNPETGPHSANPTKKPVKGNPKSGSDNKNSTTGSSNENPKTDHNFKSSTVRPNSPHSTVSPDLKHITDPPKGVYSTDEPKNLVSTSKPGKFTPQPEPNEKYSTTTSEPGGVHSTPEPLNNLPTPESNQKHSTAYPEKIQSTANPFPGHVDSTAEPNIRHSTSKAPFHQDSTITPGQESSTQEPSKGHSTFPTSRYSTSVPRSQHSTLKPDSETVTMEPVIRRSTHKPRNQFSEEEPSDIQSTPEPPRQYSTSNPPTRHTTSLPWSTYSTLDPVTKSTTSNPIIKSSTLEPSVSYPTPTDLPASVHPYSTSEPSGSHTNPYPGNRHTSPRPSKDNSTSVPQSTNPTPEQPDKHTTSKPRSHTKHTTLEPGQTQSAATPIGDYSTQKPLQGPGSTNAASEPDHRHSTLAPNYEYSTTDPEKFLTSEEPFSKYSTANPFSQYSSITTKPGKDSTTPETTNKYSSTHPPRKEPTLVPGLSDSTGGPEKILSTLRPGSRISTTTPLDEYSTEKAVDDYSMTTPAQKHSTSEPNEKQSTFSPESKHSTVKPLEEYSTVKPVHEHSTLSPGEISATSRPKPKRSTSQPDIHTTVDPFNRHTTSTPGNKHTTFEPSGKYPTSDPSYGITTTATIAESGNSNNGFGTSTSTASPGRENPKSDPSTKPSTPWPNQNPAQYTAHKTPSPTGGSSSSTVTPRQTDPVHPKSSPEPSGPGGSKNNPGAEATKKPGDKSSFPDIGTVPTNGIGTGTTIPDFTGDVNETEIDESIAQQEQELGNEFLNPARAALVLRRLQEVPDGLIVQLCVIWVLTFILLFVILVLGYHIHQMLRWRELQSYKETRMLYRPTHNKLPPGQARPETGKIRMAWDSFYDLFASQVHLH